MSSKKLFSNLSPSAKPTDTVNNAGGKAYSLNNKAALAQLALTGCFNGTFYVSDEDQLKTVLALANQVSAEYLAKLAVYSRQNGLMKDMPAFLSALVACQDPELLSKIFDRTINNPKMMRNFVQIIRSGVTGRKSLGTRPKKLLQKFLASLSNEALFNADVGNDPSLQDVIKLVHPKPEDKQRAALYSYLLDKEHNIDDLPQVVRQYEVFKSDMRSDLPKVDFQKLTALPLRDNHWNKIAEHASWDQTRRNLNTFARHGVFNDKKMVELISARLENEELIKRSHVLPYNLFTTFQNLDSSIPVRIAIALQRAVEIALSNIPEYKGDVYVMVDTSGSMSMNPVTGKRGTATTKTHCIHVAALFAAAIMKKNPMAEIMPFSTKVHKSKLNPMDSVMTNVEKLAALGGGGTNCAAPLEVLKNWAKFYQGEKERYADELKTDHDPRVKEKKGDLIELLDRLITAYNKFNELKDYVQTAPQDEMAKMRLTAAQDILSKLKKERSSLKQSLRQNSLSMQEGALQDEMVALSKAGAPIEDIKSNLKLLSNPINKKKFQVYQELELRKLLNSRDKNKGEETKLRKILINNLPGLNASSDIAVKNIQFFLDKIAEAAKKKIPIEEVWKQEAKQKAKEMGKIELQRPLPGLGHQFMTRDWSKVKAKGFAKNILDDLSALKSNVKDPLASPTKKLHKTMTEAERVVFVPYIDAMAKAFAAKDRKQILDTVKALRPMLKQYAHRTDMFTMLVITYKISREIIAYKDMLNAIGAFEDKTKFSPEETAMVQRTIAEGDRLHDYMDELEFKRAVPSGAGKIPAGPKKVPHKKSATYATIQRKIVAAKEYLNHLLATKGTQQ